MPEDPTRYRTIDSTRELAERARTLFASRPGSDPLQSLGVRQAVEANLTAVEPGVLESVELEVAAGDVLRDAAAAMDKVREGNESNVTDREFAALEAIVLLSSRPAMRYTNCRVQMPVGEDNEQWGVFVNQARKKINDVSGAVGQIGVLAPDDTISVLGTAWRLGDDLAVTNRHVARRLVSDISRPFDQWALDTSRRTVVNFCATDDAKDMKKSTFAIAELLYVAPETRIDFAVLRLDPGGRTLPAALPLDWSAKSLGRNAGGGFDGEKIYVVGHPSHPYESNEVVTVFQRADGFKRCSPGIVTKISDLDYAFEHDCSTLGGNSGSCVVTAGTHKVVGLHYGGRNVDEHSGTGDANLALALSRLGTNRAAKILKDGRVA